MGLVVFGAGCGSKGEKATTAVGLAISPSSTTVAPLTVVTFTVSGGTDPVSVAILVNGSGGGSLSFDTGTRQGSYTAGPTDLTTDELLATDALSATAKLTITITAAGGGGGSTFQTIAGTDRFYMRFDFDHDGNSTPDFDQVVAGKGWAAQRDAIRDDCLATLYERFDNNRDGTLAPAGFSISFSDNLPTGRAAAGTWELYNAGDNLYSQIALRAIGGAGGTVGINTLDSGPPLNRGAENNANSSTLGVYVDRIANITSTPSQFAAVFATVAAHEIGHGIGMAHDTVSGFIMWSSTNAGNPQQEFSSGNKTAFNAGALPGPNR